MSRPLHLPSIAGCAIGFCAAGSGVGSLIGTAIGPFFFPEFPEGQGTIDQRMAGMYGGPCIGIVLGMGLGFVAGVVYAIRIRRRRLAGAASDNTTA